ncbi:hypothetical protein AMTRI_Chr05g68700 [Amborella trichopoda]
MKTFKDWISWKSLLSARPLSGSDSFLEEDETRRHEDVDVAASGTPPGSSGTASTTSACPANGIQSSASCPYFPPVVMEDCHSSPHYPDGKSSDILEKLDALQVNFLRLVHRLGQSSQNLVVAQVLYRLELTKQIRASDSNARSVGLSIDRVKTIAREQETAGQGGSELDFSINVLLLGKTGVGKSATINSIFNQAKVFTDAFQPATEEIQEIIGTVMGVKVKVIDTPGLLPSPSDQRLNRRNMHTVKRFIRNSPPDIVLYFDRLDVINMGYSDVPLLKLITETFGSAIWFNTIIVLTHSSSALPEGPDGTSLGYEAFVTQCKNIMQHHIHQAAADMRLRNPLLLVENHPLCIRNREREKVLPNGQAWRSQFLLLCISSKVLNDANALLKFQDVVHGKQNNQRRPSLPHLLSFFLQPCSAPNASDLMLIDEVGEEVSYLESEDEYDKLPPIRILSKGQFKRLSKAQKEDYLDELDYRETLYLKKQLKEELGKCRDGSSINDKDGHNEGEPPPDTVPLPDMAMPLSFDSACPTYRYRSLEYGNKWLVRPVLDPHGWDQEIGFDGVNLEASFPIVKNLNTSLNSQLSKDKQDCNFQMECAATHIDEKGPSYYTGLDVQNLGRGLACTARGHMQLKTHKYNKAGCGFLMGSIGSNVYVGAKLEDTIAKKRWKLVVDTGGMASQGDMTFGGRLEGSLRGKDYPVRRDQASVSLTMLSCNKEVLLEGGLLVRFRPARGTNMAIQANVNHKKSGQICIKANSSEHIQIALIAIIPIVRALFRRRAIQHDPPVTDR